MACPQEATRPPVTGLTTPRAQTVAVDNADDNQQQSHVAASSESKDRCVTQNPLMSTTMDGLATSTGKRTYQ